MTSPTNRWQLVSFRPPDSDQVLAGIAVGESIYPAPAYFEGRSVFDALSGWDDLEPRLRQWQPIGQQPVPGARLNTPLMYPSKVICAGANYYDHIVEMGTPDPSGKTPYFFLKPPRTTVIGPDEPIRLPNRESRRIDWEVELAVVIGRGGRDIDAHAALGHVAGYTVLNDISARDLLEREDAIAPPFTFDWLGAKGGDTFCPVGPGITPVWLVPDPQNLWLRLTVNGTVKQNSSTTKMIYSIRTLIAAASAMLTLEPGDLIATGTPAGVGLARGEFLASGDDVVAEIEGLGRLRNPVI